jgi:isopenicillin-N N-acyltransferase-like protein
MKKLRVLQVSGSPYAMGYTHGQAFCDEIALLTEERLRLCTDPFWTGGRAATLDEVLALGQACLQEHWAFDPLLMEEMQGMADAIGLGLNELVIMNGFTDFVDVIANDRNAARVFSANGNGYVSKADDGGCTAFIVEESASADGRAYLGQTWDMHASATPHVILLDVRPDDGPALLIFTITGCIGMMGMNEHGVAVGVNNLSGADGRIGVHWTYVTRKMLAQPTADGAMETLLNAKLSGGHNYVVLGPDNTGALKGWNVEAMATCSHTTPVRGIIAHTNHCLAPHTQAQERARKALSLQSTMTRLAQAQRLLAAQLGAVTIDSLMTLTRYQEPGEMSICAVTRPGYDIESSGACIMSPTTGEFWAVWGVPAENEYERFVVSRNRTVDINSLSVE